MMTPTTRALLFIGLCIPFRLLLAYTPQLLNNKVKQQVYALLMLLIGSTFLYLWYGNKRLNAGEGGGKTWWAPYRVIHGILFLAAAALMLCEPKKASIPLVIDVIIGIYLFFSIRVNVLDDL